MVELYKLISRVAPVDSSVLITGESGTGKELVARTIHYNSPRAEKPFVAINCGAIPEDLLESELFGHVKGSFTGAIAHKAGLLEVARGGTVFLDEVAEMSPDLQVKLLRVLQDHIFRRVGGTDDIEVGHPRHRRHQQGAGPAHSDGRLPGGPVLPAQRHLDRDAAAARAP